jgi:hypothetical protein
VVLHLLPGALTFGFYVAVGVPVTTRHWVTPRCWLLLAVAGVLVPSEVGLLLYLGSRIKGRLWLDGIVVYREPVPLRRFVSLVLVLFGWLVLVEAILSPWPPSGSSCSTPYCPGYLVGS